MSRARLAELIGPAAGRLHTARSRNDQVALDFRLWVRDAIDALDRQIAALQRALADKRAATAPPTLMPGFTHLQSAQPVTFGHHLLAYVEMLGRDAGRFADARARSTNARWARRRWPAPRSRSTAIRPRRRSASTGRWPIRSTRLRPRLRAGGAGARPRSAPTHLSRLAEEIVLWTTPQFGFITLSDAFTTGSSIMPQKRNPDAAELVRAKTGRVIGALIGLLTVMKGLPLAYSKDMQEDKDPVFDAFADARRSACRDDRHGRAT